MVFLSIDTLELTEQVEHIATDWEISDTSDFAVIHVSSIQDEKNKNSIIFSDTLDPNTKWYARARALLTTGYTELSNIHMFIPNNDTDSAASDDYPSRISTPLVKTDGDQQDHDLVLFKIIAEGFSVLGNASHVSTSWWIEDIFGKVVWSSLYNQIYKTEILISDIVLKHNMIYRAKAVFHSSSNDSSSIGTYTFYTNVGADIDLFTYLDYVDPKQPIDLLIGKLENMNNVEWEIYECTKSGEYEYVEDPNRDEVVVNEFESQGKWGMLPSEKTPIEGGKCQNNFQINNKPCEGIIVPWSKISQEAVYQKTYRKFLLYAKFVELYRDSLFLANNMLDRILRNELPVFACEKCGTIYYLNEDGTCMAVPLMKQTKGITNFRALPSGKYNILNPFDLDDYTEQNNSVNLLTDVSNPLVLEEQTGLEFEIEKKSSLDNVKWEIGIANDIIPGITSTAFGAVSIFTWQNELFENPNYKPPIDLTTIPLKGAKYKNLIWETNHSPRSDIEIRTYGLSQSDDGNSILNNFIPIDLRKGTFQIPQNDTVKKAWMYFLNPKEDITSYAGVRYWDFKLFDAIPLYLPFTGRDSLLVGPFKYFLKYPVGEIETNTNSNGNLDESYIRYTYDRGDNLKIVGYILYNELKQPTKWVNVTEDETSYIELNENYTDQYYKGLQKEVYGQTIWY